MGKSSSAKKVARAARAGGSGKTRSAGTRRSFGFPAAIAVVVLLGALMVTSARGQLVAKAADVPPSYKKSDHWHTAYGLYVCGKFLAPVPTEEANTSIHTHGDGVIHVHPFTAANSGKRATMERFFDEQTFEISPTTFKVRGAKTLRTSSDTCTVKGKKVKAVITASVWNTRDATKARVLTDDFGDIAFNRDEMLVTFSFNPKGTKVPKPDSEATLDNLSDVAGTPANESSPTTDPSADDAASTTTPEGESDESTTTTAEGETEGGDEAESDESTTTTAKATTTTAKATTTTAKPKSTTTR